MLFKKEVKQFLLSLVMIQNCIVAYKFPFNINHNKNNNNVNIASNHQHIATPSAERNFHDGNNITLLHEVQDDDSSLVLNTHEILPLKPFKNALALYEKTLIAEYEKPYSIREYKLHPVTFDFNLGDLEDLEKEIALKRVDVEAVSAKDAVRAPKKKLSDEEHVTYSELSKLISDDVMNNNGKETWKEGQHRVKSVDVLMKGTNAATRNVLNSITNKTKIMSKLVSRNGTTASAMMVTSAPSSLGKPTTLVFPHTAPKIISQPSTSADGDEAVYARRTSHVNHTTFIPQDLLPTSIPFRTFNTVIVTASPHILKVMKPKLKSKNRDIFKKDSIASAALAFNSVSGSFDYAEGQLSGMNKYPPKNISIESVNIFHLFTNLYDHFFWQPPEICNQVTTACGLELQAYLTALNGNYEWAQRAYDASGHYRGQIFYGNDKWLGEKAFCQELNRQLRPEERKHFEFQFYVALISIHMLLPSKLNMTLQLGECLPKTCTTQDVKTILSLDHHAKMLSSLTSSNSTATTDINIRLVRKVPGNFNYWLELKFRIFIGFMSTLIALVIVATWYQAYLSRKKFSFITPTVNVISNKVGNGLQCERIVSTECSGKRCNEKDVELHQMRSVNDIVDVEVDLNAGSSISNHYLVQNKGEQGRSQNKGDLGNICNNFSHIKIVESQIVGGDSCNNINFADISCGNTVVGKEIEVKDFKYQKANLEIQTCSNTGTAAASEAKEKLEIHQQLLLCFAFQTNSSVIMNINDTKETQTSCVHGMRVLSVLWTIMVHTYLQMFTIGENRFTRIIVERSLWYQFVGNATFSVDTFFFISGFLVTLLFFKQNKKFPVTSGKFAQRSLLDIAMILIYRYIRLTPAYLFVIFFNDFFLRQTFDSSVFHPTIAPDTCSLYWWRNILYINNFYPLSEICMIWSWYMANDMQFYIMASLLLIISKRYFKVAVLAISSILFSSWAVSGIISLRYNYSHKVGNPFESFDFLYDKPWQRVGTYIMGMIAGYIIYKVKDPPKLQRSTNLLLWSGSLGLLFIIIFGVWEKQLSLMKTAFYVSIGHTAFGFALIWIVLSCCWGLAKPVNRILAYRGLWPLSRLTYCTYLIHPVFMLFTSYRMEGTVHLNNLFVLTIFFGNVVISFGVAFFVSILFEAPVIRLMKIWLRK